MRHFLLIAFGLFMVFNHTEATKGYQVAIDLRKVQKDRLEVITLPFKLYENKYILLQLPMENAQDSITFYFDTGATTTLFDTEFTKRYNLKANYTQNVTGAGGTKSYEIILNQKIHITKEKYIENVNIVLEDLTRLKNSLGHRFDGIIGNDIIKNYITKIDFEKKQLSLYKSIDNVTTDNYIEIPFAFKNNIPIPQFPITIELENGTKFSGDIFFDSGAGLTLLMNSPFCKQNNVTAKVGKIISSTTNNLSNKTKTQEVLIKRLEMGQYRFNNLPIGLSSDEAGVSAYKEYLGILGSEIINRFNIILNYTTKKLYLQPNNLYNTPFEIPVSPIQLVYSNGDIIISSVIENTDAERQGLKEGQKIISINNVSSKDIDIYRNMLKQPERKVVIEYLDENNNLKIIKTKLKKLL
jgi:hypothetical protein